MLPEGSIDKVFDYTVPEADTDRVRVGTMVRVSLHGRRTGGWVVADDVAPPDGIDLKPLAKVTGWGPSAELVDLADWAAWRWAGRPAAFLRTASPPVAVRSLVPPGPLSETAVPSTDDDLLTEALAAHEGVLRLPPGADRYPLVLAAVTGPGHALVLCPTVDEARALATRLRRTGLIVACVADDRPGSAAGAQWSLAASGATVIGARAGAWAPVADLSRILVLDEHDETFQGERTPTWNARDVAIERARRASVPCLLVSPCPSLEALAWGRLIVPSRSAERRGWPALEIVDRRNEDPVSGGLYSDRLVELLRGGKRVLCVLNRVGRSRLLACAACGELGRCERCQGSVAQLDGGSLRCRRCGIERPVVCDRCGGVKFKNLRAGVARAREELAALVGEEVDEVTATTSATDLTGSRVVVGTTAVLNRMTGTDAVAFLDIDQDLTAARYRANEQALALIALGARLVRGRVEHGRVLVQTRQPDHVVLQAALHADPGRVPDEDRPLRQALGLPPAMAMALVSGPAAPEFIHQLGQPQELSIQGPADGTWRLRAPDHRILGDVLAAAARPAGRLRIEVDPLGV